MNDEPTTQPIREDDAKPATKGDVRNAVDELAEATQKGFEEVHGKFDEVDARFDEVHGKFDEVDARFDEVDGKLDTMREDIATLKGDVRATKSTMVKVLTVVESIDEHFKEHKDLPAKVREHSEEILKLKSRSRA